MPVSVVYWLSAYHFFHFIFMSIYVCEWVQLRGASAYMQASRLMSKRSFFVHKTMTFFAIWCLVRYRFSIDWILGYCTSKMQWQIHTCAYCTHNHFFFCSNFWHMLGYFQPNSNPIIIFSPIFANLSVKYKNTQRHAAKRTKSCCDCNFCDVRHLVCFNFCPSFHFSICVESCW